MQKTLTTKKCRAKWLDARVGLRVSKRRGGFDIDFNLDPGRNNVATSNGPYYHSIAVHTHDRHGPTAIKVVFWLEMLLEGLFCPDVSFRAGVLCSPAKLMSTIVSVHLGLETRQNREHHNFCSLMQPFFDGRID